MEKSDKGEPLTGAKRTQTAAYAASHIPPKGGIEVRPYLNKG